MNSLKKIFDNEDKENSHPKLSCQFFGATDTGKLRTNNEDSFLISPGKKLFIIADGMGGHNAGEVASLNAVKSVNSYLAPDLFSKIKIDGKNLKVEMKAALSNAHQTILAMANSNSAFRGMGCTIVVALIIENDLHLCHVGDARAYISNENGINLLTTDHSIVMDLLRAGKLKPEETRTSPIKNQLSQAIGSPNPIDPEYTHYTLKHLDKVLLCSDGLWDMLTDEEIHKILVKQRTGKILCKELIEAANQAGGHDNITVIVIEFKKFEDPSQI